MKLRMTPWIILTFATIVFFPENVDGLFILLLLGLFVVSALLDSRRER